MNHHSTHTQVQGEIVQVFHSNMEPGLSVADEAKVLVYMYRRYGMDIDEAVLYYKRHAEDYDKDGPASVAKWMRLMVQALNRELGR